MQPTVREYCDHYRIPSSISESDVLDHWECERQMRLELLSSSRDSRAAVFERCYSTLYSRFPWLNSAPPRAANEFRSWHAIVGSRKQRIFEVGSGKGDLIDSLSALGHDCTATEITSERGERWSSAVVRWVSCDGIHLDRDQEPASYDVVISNQVIEHLHPDDIVRHFTSACKILRQQGRYIFATPHRCVGPGDVSVLFGCRRPEGMHLKEYTYRELAGICRRSGFSRMECIFRLPAPYGRFAPTGASRAYFKYQIFVEPLLALVPVSIRRDFALCARTLLFSPNIFIVARKP